MASTEQMFSMPARPETESYITGRFGWSPGRTRARRRDAPERHCRLL